MIQSTPCLLLLTAHLPLGEAYRPHLPLPCGLCGFIYGRGNHLCPPLTRPPCTLSLCSSFWCHWSAQVPPPTMWSKDGPLPRWWCVTSCPLVLPVSSADRPSDQMMMEMTRTMSAGRTSTTTTGSVTTHTSALLGTQTTPCPFSTRMNHVRPSESCRSCKRGCWTASTIMVSSTTLPRAGVPALQQLTDRTCGNLLQPATATAAGYALQRRPRSYDFPTRTGTQSGHAMPCSCIHTYRRTAVGPYSCTCTRISES